MDEFQGPFTHNENGQKRQDFMALVSFIYTTDGSENCRGTVGRGNYPGVYPAFTQMGTLPMIPKRLKWRRKQTPRPVQLHLSAEDRANR